MDDKTALAVWAEFSKRVTTQGVEEAAALVQFTDWVRRTAAPSPNTAEHDAKAEESK